MKKILIPLTFIVIVISYCHYFLKLPIYEIIENYDYKIVNNDLFYKKENTKDNYSNHLKYLDKDIVNNSDEVYSMFYTVLNNGYDIYTFTCNYDCMKDIDNIDSLKLSLINQLVDPKNSYKEIKTTYTYNKKVTLNINKKYTEEELTKIDNELDRLIIELKVNNYYTIKDKIKVFHDYLGNKNTYDSAMAEKGESTYHSNTAIGALFEGKAICDGYSDAMAFYLNKLGIENIKVTNDNHVWNAVKVDGNWYHIDLTWDDPIYTNGGNLLVYDYFMISTTELEKKNDNEHYFDKTIYDFIK